MSEKQEIIIIKHTDKRDKDNRVISILKCFCGKEFEGVWKNVQNYRIKSCGCLKKSTRVYIECKCGCGTVIPKWVNRYRQKYADGHNPNPVSEEWKEKQRKRMKEARQGKAPWNKGKTYASNTNKEYKNVRSWGVALKRLFNDKCMMCDWDKYFCDAHHIIKRENGGKNNIDNGIILCPNCHILADNGILTEEELKVKRREFVQEDEILFPEHTKNLKNKDKVDIQYIEYKGRKHTVQEWASILNIHWRTLYCRINNKILSIEEAFTKPVRGRSLNTAVYDLSTFLNK